MKSRAGLLLHGAALVAVTVGVLVVTTSSRNNAAAGAEEYKIRIVDLQSAVDGYQMQIDESAKIRAELEAFQNEFDHKLEAWQKEKESYDNTKDSLSQEALLAKQTELDDKRMDLQNDAKRKELELKRKQDLLKDTVLKDLLAAIESVGAETNCHLILEADPESRTGVMYFSPTLDITQQVIDRLNKK